jgi:thymidylate synthase
MAMPEFASLADAYAAGLADVLAAGSDAPSVADPLSKASNFGKADRPARELIAHQFAVANPRRSLTTGPHVRLHLPYAFGLLAFTLAGNDELAALGYYRAGAAEFSDDGRTLSGAFGARLQGPGRGADQLSAIVARLTEDPASRRTYAAVISPSDNLAPTREYPCAAGVQLFIREGRLDLLTVMRAQQGFTVLPYDAFLFMALQQILAARLRAEPGLYRHFSGTFHVYASELGAVESTIQAGVAGAAMPPVDARGDAADALAARLVQFEHDARAAACAGDRGAMLGLLRHAAAGGAEPFEQTVQAGLVGFAFRKTGCEQDAAAADALLPADIRPFV